MKYIEQIEALIAEHEKAIARLTIAHGVLLQLEPTEKTRPAAKQTTQKPRAKKVDSVRGEVRGIILTTMSNMVLPATSKEIWEQVVARGADLPQKRIWNALYVMKDKGTIVRDDDGNYAFPGKGILPSPDIAAA